MRWLPSTGPQEPRPFDGDKASVLGQVARRRPSVCCHICCQKASVSQGSCVAEALTTPSRATWFVERVGAVEQQEAAALSEELAAIRAELAALRATLPATGQPSSTYGH